MKNLSLLILLILLFDYCDSKSPRKDESELPIINTNRTKVNNNAHKKKNYRYFSFSLKDLQKTFKDKDDYLFFQINSTLSSKDILYTFDNTPKKSINLSNIENDKYRTWNAPKMMIKQILPDKHIYLFAINATKDWTKETLIIKVGPSFKNEELKCFPLYNGTKTIIYKPNNKFKNQWKPPIDIPNHNKNHKHDNWGKPIFDWKNHGHDKNNKTHHFKKDKHFKKFHDLKHNKGRIVFAITLITIWNILLVLYCLVNRRRKPFVSEFKNLQQISLAEYHNV